MDHIIEFDTAQSNVVCMYQPLNLDSIRLTVSQGMHDLNEHVLDGALSNLPNLKALHVIQCTKIDHHSVLSRTSNVPLLESLSFTTWVSVLAAVARVQTYKYVTSGIPTQFTEQHTTSTLFAASGH